MKMYNQQKYDTNYLHWKLKYFSVILIFYYAYFEALPKIYLLFV
jgi:hypothetical protein